MVKLYIYLIKTQCGTILGVGWELNPDLYNWKHAHSPPRPQCSRTLLQLKHFPLHYFNIKVLLVSRCVSFTKSFCGCIYLFFCTKIIHFISKFHAHLIKLEYIASSKCINYCQLYWVSLNICDCYKDYGMRLVCVGAWVYVYAGNHLSTFITSSRLRQNTAMATSAVNTSIQTHTRHNYENKGPSGSSLGLGGTSEEGFVAPVTASKVLSLNDLTAYTVGH